MSSQDVSLFTLLLECHFLWVKSIVGHTDVCIQIQSLLGSTEKSCDINLCGSIIHLVIHMDSTVLNSKKLTEPNNNIFTKSFNIFLQANRDFVPAALEIPYPRREIPHPDGKIPHSRLSFNIRGISFFLVQPDAKGAEHRAIVEIPAHPGRDHAPQHSH